MIIIHLAVVPALPIISRYVNRLAMLWGGVLDIVTAETKDKIASSLYLEYCKEAATKGFTPGDITGEYLIEKANGIALVNERILFFFHPYNIGCGAEGQYNLIINTKLH